MQINNESELRNAIRNLTPDGKDCNYYTSGFPYWAAKQYLYTDYYGVKHHASVSVYGKHTKTIRLSRREGYKFVYKIIGKIKTKGRESAAYAEISHIIESANNSDIN